MRADIEQASRGMRIKLGAKRELKRLDQHLHPGESAMLITSGGYATRIGILVLTDLRILFFSHGWAGAAHEDFPLTVINSVGYSSGMMLSTITIHAAGNTTEITDVPKQDGQRFADAARQALTAAQTPQAQSVAPPAFVPQDPPPGWYDDGQGAMRWWDGQEWTDHVHPPG